MKSKLRNIQKQVWFSISPILYQISPVVASKVLFLFAMKKRLDLENPITFNEKIQWLKLYWQDDRVAKCGDKYDVREYVESCGLEEILNPIYGMYKNAEDIDFNKLPKKFALKGTHGCGYNIICTDKEKLDLEKTKETCNIWLKSRYSQVSAEVQYDKMEAKLIAEKFIEGREENGPVDYKVFCFNGEAKFTMVCEERGGSERAKFYFLDNKWNILPYNNDSKIVQKEGKVKNIYKPKSFEKMIEYAQKLSEPFPFVRVDFYDVDGRPVLGEMTFTPCGGIDSRLDKDVDIMMGDLITLPKEKII